MSDVRILPEIISNQIAAGEVVERPVSIVKELVENSLDAGATRITIEVKRGGRDLIRVSDNGHGMGRDNALLAIERYATSKIFSTDDLFSIKSFGFRGEALPSIASVSKFTLVTREKGADSGTKIFINGGKMMNVSDAGAPFGTEIEVRSLFFNTPVRRKFLKSVNTEMGHIADTISGMALGNRKTGFRLFHNSHLIKSFQPGDNMLKRAGEVFGSETVKQFCTVSVKADDIQVEGLISTPSLTRSTSRNIRLFVNNRLISDTGLVSAIFRGFKGRIMKGRFPMAVIFITLPFDQVDVNVHPAKLQVRFADQNKLYSTVAMAVNEALYNAEKKISRNLFHSDGKNSSVIENNFLTDNNSDSVIKNNSVITKKIEGIEEIEDKNSQRNKKSKIEEKSDKIQEIQEIQEIKNNLSDFINEPFDFTKEKISEPHLKWGSSGNTKLQIKNAKSLKENIPSKDQNIFKSDSKTPDQEIIHPSSSFHISGQIFGTYIAAESGNDFFLIDQHAAHERIVYEKLKKRAESFKPPSQNLIVPEILELGFREADLLGKIMDDLSLLGIIIEPFGGTSFIIKSVPGIIDDREISPFIREMIDKIIESGLDTGDDVHKKKWLDDVLILMACHSAIRANYALSIKDMEQLVLDLEKCDNPLHCPHGRPTRIKWAKTEIEKLFKRIV